MAYIAPPNVADRGFQNQGWRTYLSACANLFLSHANLCAAPTFVPRQNNMPMYFQAPFIMAMPMYKGGSNKIIQANIKWSKEP